MNRLSTSALVTLLLGMVIVACSDDGAAVVEVDAVRDASTGQHDAGAWQHVTGTPLSPRAFATAVAVGAEVVIVGGNTGPPCPPGADCPRSPGRRDGAVLDLEIGSWRSIVDAPVPILLATTAVLGGVAYFAVPDLAGAGTTLLSYALDDNRWEEMPLPPGLSPYGFQLTATADRLLASDVSEEDGTGRDVLSFDPASRTWSSLPPDPLPPLFSRSLLWSGSELVLLGAEIVPNPGSERPSLNLAATFEPESSTWRRLPDSDILWSGSWLSTAGMLVSPWLGSAGGGGVNNWGRSYPMGGVLDAGTGRWSPLPTAPPPGMFERSGWEPVAGDGYVVGSEGYVLDVTRSAWTSLPERQDQPSEGQAAAWAQGRLVVFGGARFDGAGGSLSGETWTWMPPTTGVESAPTSAPSTSRSTSATSPDDEARLDGLDLRLELGESTLAPGGSTASDLVVANGTNEVIVDPSCVLGNFAFGVVPLDEPDAELNGTRMTACAEEGVRFPSGFDDRRPIITFFAVNPDGEPLEPGQYLAVTQFGGGIGRLTAPLTVADP